MPVISILTPCFNAAQTLYETARSVIGQSFADWEWIIVDDASPDSSAEILKSLAAQNVRIKPVFLEQNNGPAMARQHALEKATSPFIAFLDADDVWMPEKLEKQIAFMKQKNAALSYTAFRRINHDSSITGRLVQIPVTLTYQQLLSNTAIVCSSAIINRDISGAFSIKNKDYDDFTTWLDILKRRHMAYGLNEDLVRYRVRAGSDSSNKIKAIKRVWAIYRDIEKLSLVKSIQALTGYGWNAVTKRIGF